MLLGWCLIYVASTFGVSLSHCLTGPVTLCAMTKTSGAMHVAKITTKRVDKSGQPREYISHLLRRTYRDGARVKHETLANLTPLPQAAIDAVRASLAGKALVVAGEGLEVTGSRPHGHVAAVHAQAKALGLPGLLGPAHPGDDQGQRDVPLTACRPEQPGQAQRLGRGVDRGDVPVRTGTGHFQALTCDHQRLTCQRGPDRVDRGLRQRG